MIDILKAISMAGGAVIIWAFALASLSLCASLIKVHWK